MPGMTESVFVEVMTLTICGSLRYGSWAAGVARWLAELLDTFELDELRLTSPADVLVTLRRRDEATRDERGQLADDLTLARVDPFTAGDPLEVDDPEIELVVPALLDDAVLFALTQGELLLDLLCAPLALFVPLVPVCAFAIATMTKLSAITVTTWERVCAVLI
jgi:hypothetical protein